MKAARNKVMHAIVQRSYSRVYGQVQLPFYVGGRIYEDLTVKVHRIRRAVGMDIET